MVSEGLIVWKINLLVAASAGASFMWVMLRIVARFNRIEKARHEYQMSLNEKELKKYLEMLHKWR